MDKKLFGRYEIEEALGEGGMAVVYRARDPFMSRQVALKVLAAHFSTDPLFKDRFHREAEVLAALEHPSIVPIFDFGQQDGQFYIVMRYMSGGSLADRLEKKALRPGEIAEIIGRIAEALDTAHERQIVHRDLKPGNILFDDRGAAFVADFGIAQTTAPATGMTGVFFFGTPAYMSPEQVRNYRLDGRSDVYALGCVLFEMLTGRAPYDFPSLMDIVLAHVTEPIPKVRDLKPRILEAWDEIVGRAMAKKAEERYPTAGAMARDVKEVASGRWFFRKLS